VDEGILIRTNRNSALKDEKGEKYQIIRIADFGIWLRAQCSGLRAQDFLSALRPLPCAINYLESTIIIFEQKSFR
jgi:hypothetical protein